MKIVAGSRPIVFVWENFGPLHVDRCEAIACALPEAPVVGLEILSESSEYDWVSESGTRFKKVTLSEPRDAAPWSAWKISRKLLELRPRAIFFCHYQRPGILLSAIMARILGIPTFTMNDSKFDDYSRSLPREVLKSLFLLPYQGAIAASDRSADYMRFLGMRTDRIALGYDAVSTKRIRALAGAPPAPDGMSFAERHFTIVARLIPKKNIAVAIEAFARLRSAGSDRRLVICGSGPLESELRQLVQNFDVSDAVDFKGFIQTSEVCQVLSRTLSLILPSTEEQFGQVIPEALSLGVPVIVSENCGARDHLVESGVNGFVFEPRNVAGLAYYMEVLSTQEDRWASMAREALRISERGDTDRFVASVVKLLTGNTGFPITNPR